MKYLVNMMLYDICRIFCMLSYERIGYDTSLFQRIIPFIDYHTITVIFSFVMMVLAFV